MTQKAFYFDPDRCTGCKTCAMACKDYHDLGPDYTYRRVYDYEGGGFTQGSNGAWSNDAYVYHVSSSCQHCDDPACTKVCPTTAMHKSPDTGLVSVDVDKCIGCGYCEMACPYGAPHVDRQEGHSVKCDGCASRVAEGKQPICTEACLMRCLEFGDKDEMSKKGERASVAPLPEASHTSPNLYVKKSSCVKPSGDTTGHVANPLEVV